MAIGFNKHYIQSHSTTGKWARAVVSYSDMLASVEPMRREVANLQKEAEETESSVKDVIDLIARL